MDCTFLHTQIGPKEADFFDVFSGKLLECAICHRGMFQAYVLPSGFVGPGSLQACDPHFFATALPTATNRPFQVFDKGSSLGDSFLSLSGRDGLFLADFFRARFFLSSR